ncbi:MAG: CARDB domain-containing protein, partial [Planctomycetota bacterium]
MTNNTRVGPSSISSTNKLYKKSYPLPIYGLFIFGILFSSGFSTTALAAPDLIAYGISVSDTTVNPGQSITVYWTAKNQGTSIAYSTQQGVMLSTNNIISRSDTLLEREALGWMSAGNTSPEAHTITIPSSATPGSTYYIGIIADYDYDESESNESNNDDGTPATVTINIPPKPDLIAYSISVSDTTVNPGQSVTVYWTAKNQGNASCGSSQQGVMWSTNSTISRSDTLLEKEYLGGLSPGQSTPESHTITIPSNATPGSTYYIGAYEDYDLTISESDETNNASSGVAVTINVPDLIAYSCTVTDTTVNPGQSITVNWTAKNQGNGSAGSSQQGVMWSTDSTISRGDTLREKELLGPMGVGATT